MNDLESVAQLVVEAQQRDARAFSELVRRFFSMVHGLALSATGSWTAADDVAQEVFLIAWANLADLRQPKAFPVWLRRIARNVGVNWLRNEDYRSRLSASAAAQTRAVTPESQDPAAVAARQECLDQIGRAVEKLSPRLRDAVILFYLEGKSVAESAAALGIKVDTMKKRLRLGRIQLKRNYARDGTVALDQLLPYSPQRHVERIMAALAAGPAVPAFGKRVAAWGPCVSLHHLWHGGSLAALVEAGLVKTKFLAVAACLLAALGAGSGFFLAGRAWKGLSESSLPEAASSGNAAYYEGTGIITTKHWNDPRMGNYLRVESVLPGYPCDRAGLRVGDRIIAVNGHAVSEDFWAVKTNRFAGPAGTTVRVAVLRRQPDGREQQVDLEIVRDYIPWELQQKAYADFVARSGLPHGKEDGAQ